jgi:hypothetical protein
MSAREMEQFERRSLFMEDHDSWLALPAMRLWDVVPTFHPARLAVGERWADHIQHRADSLGNHQLLEGDAVSTLVGDTTIAGRKLWLVSVVMSGRYDESALIEERTLDTLVTISRAGTAVTRARLLYDPSVGLARLRDDTMQVVGRARLHYPDGRIIETPAREERVRHWVLYDAAGYNARRAAIKAEQERTQPGGVVFVPMNDLDRRMSSGDRLARDSLLAL